MPTFTPHAGVVLVVDDAVETLGFLCEALSQQDYTVLVARNAAEALVKAAHEVCPYSNATRNNVRVGLHLVD